jgi:hypothetical protein
MTTQWTPEAGRYTKGKNIIGDIVFYLLRTLDLPLQYNLLQPFSTLPTAANPITLDL